jgi:hypothetical protein
MEPPTTPETALAMAMGEQWELKTPLKPWGWGPPEWATEDLRYSEITAALNALGWQIVRKPKKVLRIHNIARSQTDLIR